MMEEIMRPAQITIGDKLYYDSDALRNFDQAYFHGCSRTIRKIIEKKSIPRESYAFANWGKKTNWVMSANQEIPPTKAKLLLAADWVTQNFPKFMSGENNNLYEYMEAPSVITLDDDEKFKDGEVTIEIETRGERTHRGIYFRASDVSNVFEIPSLINDVLHDDRRSYKQDDDYKIFLCKKPVNYSKTTKKELFITYDGMIHILFSSHSKKAKTFRSWATETLFTIQMGSVEKKEELVSGIIGMPIKSLRAVLKTNATSTPCIYRFALGSAKDLRKSMNLPANIPDDFVIIKYGYTDDLERRSAEHIKTYEKITKNLELMNYAYIDPKFLSQAEVRIKEFFQDIEIPVKYDSFAELVAINPKHEKTIKQQFKYINIDFAGSIKDLIDQIEKMKIEHKITIMEKDNKIALIEKDLKYEQLKNELLELKLHTANLV